MNYLPSKRFIVLAISISISGAGLWLVAKSKEPTPRIEPAKSVAAKNSPTVMSSAPTHTLKQSKIVASEPASEKSVPLPTDTLLKSLLLQFNSRNFTDQDIQKLLTDAEDSLKKIASETKNVYHVKDAKINQNVSVRNYLNEVGRIIQNRFPDAPSNTSYKSEVEVLQSLSGEKISLDEFSSNMQKFSTGYHEAADDLKKLAVPPEIVDLHVGLINSFSNTGLAVTQLAIIKIDPLIAMSGLRTYGEEIVRSILIVRSMKEIAEKYHIVFYESEPGYELQQYFKRI